MLPMLRGGTAALRIETIEVEWSKEGGEDL